MLALHCCGALLYADLQMEALHNAAIVYAAVPILLSLILLMHAEL